MSYYQQQPVDPKQQQYYSQPYYQQQQPPNTFYAPPEQQVEYKPPYQPPQNNSEGVKFNPKPKYNDAWASILFLLAMTSMAGLGYVGVKYLVDNLTKVSGSSSINLSSEDSLALGLSLGIASVIGLGITCIYFMLMQRFAGQMIVATGVAMVVIELATAFYMLYLGSYITGIIMIVFALLSAWILWAYRHRIPFAKVMLETVTSITGQYPATWFFGFIGLIFNIAYSALWISTLAGWSLMYADKKISQGVAIFLWIYLLFLMYWTSQVIKNVVHVTVSGLFASFYFLGTPHPTRPGKVVISTKNPTLKAAGRAVTTSFGSICYGSLIIALIETLRAIVRTAANDSAADGNLFAAFCLFCLDCLMACIQGMAEYFNHYAFTQVAIYGKDYCTAGKDTWNLFKARGIDAIVNDDMIGSVLGFGALLTGLLTGAFAGLWVYLSSNSLNDSSGTIAAIAIYGLLIGSTEFAILGSTIFSGIASTFVCLAEDPAALQRTKPELYNKIAQVYPEVTMRF